MRNFWNCFWSLYNNVYGVGLGVNLALIPRPTASALMLINNSAYGLVVNSTINPPTSSINIIFYSSFAILTEDNSTIFGHH